MNREEHDQLELAPWAVQHSPRSEAFGIIDFLERSGLAVCMPTCPLGRRGDIPEESPVVELHSAGLHTAD